MTNPWLDPIPTAEEDTGTPPAPSYRAPRIAVDAFHAIPQGPPLPHDQIAVVAAHGGAGATTWAELLTGQDCGRTWPGENTTPTRTVVVARNDYHGLTSAQTVGLQWATGMVPGVELIGLILTPDQKGRTPKELRDLARKVEAIYPAVFKAPYVPAWKQQPRHQVPAGNNITKIVTKIKGDK